MTSNDEGLIGTCKNDVHHTKVEFRNGDPENKEEVTI